MTINCHLTFLGIQYTGLARENWYCVRRGPLRVAELELNLIQTQMARKRGPLRVAEAEFLWVGCGEPSGKARV
jgi:hypothetical protein